MNGGLGAEGEKVLLDSRETGLGGSVAGQPQDKAWEGGWGGGGVAAQPYDEGGGGGGARCCWTASRQGRGEVVAGQPHDKCTYLVHLCQ